jgi:anthranilate synthase/aminodeoxychorismate synthase-like glutamine amidotransferase
MKILLIDNYDSFTYNLVQYLAELGADLTVFRNDMITVEEVARKKPDGLVLSPGPGRPEKAGNMNDLIKKTAGEIPILGVCLGHQAIGQVYGGKIDYAPTLMHGKTSKIEHNSSVIYNNIPSPFIATRYHSLVIAPESLPAEFQITSWTDDGVIMGLQHKKLPLYGMQFHPESILTEVGKKLLNNFLETL